MCIVCNENPVIEVVEYFLCYFAEGRGIKHHFLCNSCKSGDVVGNTPARIDESMKDICEVNTVVVVNGYFRYAVLIGITSGRLNVNNGVHAALRCKSF